MRISDPHTKISQLTPTFLACSGPVCSSSRLSLTPSFRVCVIAAVLLPCLCCFCRIYMFALHTLPQDDGPVHHCLGHIALPHPRPTTPLLSHGEAGLGITTRSGIHPKEGRRTETEVEGKTGYLQKCKTVRYMYVT